MWLLFLAIVAGMFAAVLLKGAPYVPVRRKEQQAALQLLQLKPGEVVVDLGSGDGAFLLAAAQAGLVAYGYELNPLLWLISKIRCYKYQKQVRIYWGDFWKADFPPATKGVYVFLLDKFMRQLDNHLEDQAAQLQRPLKVVSYTFELPDRTPVARQGALFYYEIAGK